MGQEAFLQLLVAQLQNQDPLDPTDSREFVTLLSQLSGVEQMVQMNERLAAIEIGQAGIVNAQLGSLVGRTVTAASDGAWLGASGGATVGFELGARAERIEVSIRDESGKVVRTLEQGETFPGTRSVSWDGLDAAGVRVPAGRYSVEVKAFDASGRPVPVTQEVTGIVSGISFESGVPELVVGDLRVRLGDVTRIAQ
jgi:flagellar basal-body rod modification protein FlgD